MQVGIPSNYFEDPLQPTDLMFVFEDSNYDPTKSISINATIIFDYLFMLVPRPVLFKTWTITNYSRDATGENKWSNVLWYIQIAFLAWLGFMFSFILINVKVSWIETI